jgi:hypothetical protein
MQNTITTKAPIPALHDQDYYTWTQEQARLLSEGRYDLLDMQNLIEEIYEMGGSVLNAFISHSAIVAAHLMQWQYQVERRGSSWEKTIKAQRARARRILAKNPGIKGQLTELYMDICADAISIAARDMGEFADRLPEECSYTLEQILDDNFWPESD